jgi:hypothetical protein
MLMFLLSLAFVSVTFFIGALVVRTIAIIPLSILARAAEAGRYVRLGARELPSPMTPGAGRRSPALQRGRGNAFQLARAEAR